MYGTQSFQQTNNKDDNNVIKIISLRRQASKVVRLINHSVSHASVVASFHLRTSSQDPTVGSEIVREDCALLWFNPLLEGQVEIRNSYDSLPTFICTIASRSVCVCVCVCMCVCMRWRKHSLFLLQILLRSTTKKKSSVSQRKRNQFIFLFYKSKKKIFTNPTYPWKNAWKVRASHENKN